MKILMFQPDDCDIFDLSDFCHSTEMENFSNYLYLKHKGTRTGMICWDDPCEDFINGISPKVFALLMKAREDLYFSPVQSSPAESRCRNHAGAAFTVRPVKCLQYAARLLDITKRRWIYHDLQPTSQSLSVIYTE